MVVAVVVGENNVAARARKAKTGRLDRTTRTQIAAAIIVPIANIINIHIRCMY